MQLDMRYLKKPSWSRGFIVNLAKKGDLTLCDNLNFKHLSVVSELCGFYVKPIIDLTLALLSQCFSYWAIVLSHCLTGSSYFVSV